MAVVAYRRPKWLYPAQREAIFAEERYSFIEASTKAGKTVGCIAWLLEQALQGQSGHNYWWVAPVSGQARIAFGRMVRMIPQELRTTNKTDATITLANGAIIWFKSAEDPDNLFGEDVYAAVIDEASRVREESWHAVRSTITATRGPVRFIGNVKGRRNWFYKMARKAEGGEPGMHYAKLTWRDAVGAGVLDAEEIEGAKRELPEAVFRELYEAEASDDEGNPFGIDKIKAIIAPLSTAPGEWFGIDLAKKRDWTVIHPLDADGATTTAWDRFQKPWDETETAVSKAVGSKAALADSTGVGDPIVEGLKKTNRKLEGWLFTGPSKQKLMEGLASEMHKQTFTVPRGVIVNELEAFEYVYTRTGVKYSAPEGMHDDAVCALALAVMCRATAKAPRTLSFATRR